jgi:DNA topoisomerase-3
MHVCRSVKGNLVVRRPRFSALTPADINRAVGPALGVPDANAAAAVSLRQEIDLRLGAAFTRWQTLAVQDAFEWHCPGFYDFTKEDGKSPLISYGPCQFPTLGFIVQRAWERESHVVEPFWVIEMTHSDGAANASFTWKACLPHACVFSCMPLTRSHLLPQRQRVFDQVLAALLYQQCCRSGTPPTAVITSAQGSGTSHAAPVPLATLGLQTRACRALRCSPEKVMAAAESLYQSGFISYPRTETDKFPPDLDLRPLVEEQRQEPRWGQYAAELVTVPGRMRVPRDGGHSDGAHPPIYPTKCPGQQQYNSWSREQKGVYDLVARHFLACVSLDATGHQTVVVASLGGEEFTTRGLSILDQGFLRIYGKGPAMPGGQLFDFAFDSWGGNANLPPYVAGTAFVPTRLTLAQRQTQAPGLMTEAELLTLMDRHGIGTDATQASHIEKVCGGRGYAQRHGDGTVAPTSLGEALVAGYQAMGMGRLWEPNLRAAMERDCAEVAAGRLNKDATLARWLVSMRKEFDTAQGQVSKLRRVFALFFEPKHGGGGHGGGRGGGGGGGGPGGGGGGGRGGGGGGGGRGPPPMPQPPMLLGGLSSAMPPPARNAYQVLGRGIGDQDAGGRTGAGRGGKGGAKGGKAKATAEAGAPPAKKARAAAAPRGGGRGAGRADGRGRDGGAGGRGGGAAPAAGPGRGGGPNTCFKCGQTGHWSKDCKNR